MQNYPACRKLTKNPRNVKNIRKVPTRLFEMSRAKVKIIVLASKTDISLVMEKNVYNQCANTKCADQPARPRSLISTFSVRYAKRLHVIHSCLHSKFQYSRLPLQVSWIDRALPCRHRQDSLIFS